MCLFVAVGAVASLDAAKAAFGPELEVTEAQNPELRKLLPEPMRRFWVTRRGCSCDLQPYERRHDVDQMRRRLEKKGWSRNKIDRAIAQSTGPGPRKAESEAQRVFRIGLRELAASGEVLVFGHWYHGDENSDAIDGEPEATPVSIAEVVTGPLPRLEEALLRVPRIVA